MADEANKRSVIYARPGITDDKGEELTFIPKSIKNGSTLRGIMIAFMIFTILTIVLSGICIERSEKYTSSNYLYITVCVIAAVMLIAEIIFLNTTVRSLMVEDIMASSIQRLSAGTMQIKDFQSTAGEYFKKRLYTANTNLDSREAGRAVGRNLLGI